MPTVRKSVIVARPCTTMFDLVERCERYPEFLPWCSGAQVFERTESETRARLDIDYHGLRTQLSTVNRKDRPRRIDLDFLAGPFERFHGHWSFTPLGDAGCRVDFSLDYAFSSAILDRLLGRAFEHIAATLVERFVERAESLPPQAP